MINKQNNIKVKETTKVKNLRYNPSRVDNSKYLYLHEYLQSIHSIWMKLHLVSISFVSEKSDQVSFMKY